MRKAIYAFSGDPITVGHINIIERAAALFDELIVAIGINPTKHYLFSLAERQSMASESLRHLPNVTVASFTGLLVDYAYEVGASVIVRGARTDTDLRYERNLYWLGDSQQNIDTVVLFARQELAHISSSAVKEIQLAQGFVQEYVTLAVKQRLEGHMSGQYFMGVTGEVGVGKNYLSEKIVALAKTTGLEVHHIDLDTLAHEILAALPEKKYEVFRKQLSKLFGSQVISKTNTVDRKVISAVIFADQQKRERFNQLMSKPLLSKFRQALFGKKGLILVNGALLAEFGWLSLVNNQVLLVSTSLRQQRSWLEARNWSKAEIESRLAAQASHTEKKKIIKAAIAQHGFGNLIEVKNSPGNDLVIERVYKELIEVLHLPST